MSIAATVQHFPSELQFPMLEFAEAFEQKMHSELVAGEAITEGASDLAARQQALVLQDGRRFNWPQALESALGQSLASPNAAA